MLRWTFLTAAWLCVVGAADARPAHKQAAAQYFGSFLPLMYVGILPSIYGGWLYLVFGLTQHAGLAEDVLDHRRLPFSGDRRRSGPPGAASRRQPPAHRRRGNGTGPRQ